MAEDFYSLMGLPYNATAEEIRSAYFQFARTYHPDVNDDPASHEKFLQIQAAYEILSNPQKRKEYDASLPEELFKEPEISIITRYSRTVLASMDEPQLVYCLVDLICTADINPDALSACHICLVLDRSTSMQGQRMDMVKSSSLNLLQQLRSQDILSVIAFSDRAEVLIPPTRASALSKSDHRISLMQTGGGTEILQGLKLGLQQLKESSSAVNRQLILVTDGHTYGDDNGCIELAREAADMGVTINVLGIGDDWNDALMDQIAALSGGNTLFISAPRDMDSYMLQKITDLEAVYARGIKFEFESAAGVQLRDAFRLIPNLGPLDTKSPILVGDIQQRKSISILFEFLLPPLQEESDRFSLATGKLWMEIPGSLAGMIRVPLDLSRPVKVDPEPEVPPSVIIEAMSKLTLYKMQEKVRLEVNAGELEKATRHMHYLATHLLSQGDRELAHTVLIEAEHVQQSQHFSGEGEKRIKYGTRALLLPPGLEIKP